MERIKLAISGILAAATARLGILALPVYLLVFLNMADYSTGIAAAYYKGEKISSKTGFRGIAKKICMWLLIAVGVVVDKMLIYTAQVSHINISFSFMIGCFVAIWLICNEVISIIENINAIGVKTPDLLSKIISKLKEAVKDSTDK